MTQILSLNLGGYGEQHDPWRARRPLVAAVLAEQQPDLVALQAVARDPAIARGCDQATQLAHDVGGYEVVYRPATRGPGGRESGLALLSRVSPLAVHVHPLSRRGDDDPFDRVLLHGVFPGPRAPLHVVCAHLSWIEAQAGDNVGELLVYLAAVPGPRLLLGDFNQTPTSDALARLRGAGLVDAWAALRPCDPGHTFFEAGAPTRRIDYLLLDRRLGPRACEVSLVLDRPGERRASDHAGLLARLGDDGRADVAATGDQGPHQPGSPCPQSAPPA
ncbi:endonuclease/exonuclease/phosphatase family protein [Nannocystis bainbridge]|uniref:Endonuclease/exonuclease/phosphatase family protein n=1 Tax=Nannocystis bainbridge TaxID=2995303 RepID=A0ABT5DPY0_9BACT|nr:endonuclease/exonuclease/phosphatase family protein [Nannocystis bainbridge]MDC0715654.1 endonuclease/exonuclease/phosphatase family protein [Nannocystis bainbridge]